VARIEEHIEELLKLSVEDRAQAAKVLLDSLDGERDTGAEEAWAVEIERRIARIEAGQAKLIASEDALARIQRAARVQ
jgi:putative addiction module component (TIGR02574 family)